LCKTSLDTSRRFRSPCQRPSRSGPSSASKTRSIDWVAENRPAMRRLFALLFGMLLGGALVFTAFRYHLVRAGEKEFLLVPKQQADLADAYVDVRGWDAAEWQKHPKLAEALTRYGRADLVKRPVDGWLQDLWRSWGTKVVPPSSPHGREP